MNRSLRHWRFGLVVRPLFKHFPLPHNSSHTLALYHAFQGSRELLRLTPSLQNWTDPPGATLQLSGTQLKHGLNRLDDDSPDDHIHPFGYAEKVVS